MIKYLFTAFLFVFMACGGNDSSNPMPGNSVRPTVTPSSGTTPKGIVVKTSIPLSLEILQSMDSALDQLFEDVAPRNYKQKIRHSDYTIIVKNDCIDVGGTKSWLDRLDAYNGTPYDVNPDPVIGEIYRAEQVTFRSFEAPEFIICRDIALNMRNTTRYGAEHIILKYNDPNEYNRTAFHTGNIQHPIIPITP